MRALRARLVRVTVWLHTHAAAGGGRGRGWASNGALQLLGGGRSGGNVREAMPLFLFRVHETNSFETSVLLTLKFCSRPIPHARVGPKRSNLKPMPPPCHAGTRIPHHHRCCFRCRCRRTPLHRDFAAILLRAADGAAAGDGCACTQW